MEQRTTDRDHTFCVVGFLFHETDHVAPVSCIYVQAGVPGNNLCELLVTARRPDGQRVRNMERVGEPGQQADPAARSFIYRCR